MVYGIYNELVTGAYKPTNITGGPHIVWIRMSWPRILFDPVRKIAAWWLNPTPLKNMSLSLGMMTFPYVINMFQTTNQVWVDQDIFRSWTIRKKYRDITDLTSSARNGMI